MSPCKPAVYKRRMPESTALYKILQTHFESWLSEYLLNHQEPVPCYVERDSALSHKVLRIFIDAIEQQYKKNVVVPTKAKIGSITFLQRFDSSLNLHFHDHTLVMDVLFYQDDQGRVKHRPVEGLGIEDSTAISEVVRQRVLKLFEREGLFSPDQVADMRSWKNSGFSLNADVCIESTNRLELKRLVRIVPDLLLRINSCRSRKIHALSLSYLSHQ